MSSPPQIQIISRELGNYKVHHLVTLPNEILPPLPPSSIRVKTSLFHLSTNNFTYARLGHIGKWWDFHPLPSSTPAPYKDPEKYGRISAWGIGTVIESTSPIAPVGTKCYGYLPIGTLPVDKQIAESDAPGQFLEVTEHRKQLGSIYQRYFILPFPEPSEESQAWDSTMSFSTSHLLNQWAFSWDPEGHPPIHPSAVESIPWTAQDADLKDAVVLVFAPAGKNAAAFAYQCRNVRPKDKQPRTLIGVGSETSKPMSEGFGYYDAVALYSSDPLTVVGFLDPKITKLVILDFGSREYASISWGSVLKPHVASISIVLVGGSPSNAKGTREALTENPGLGLTIGNANDLREYAIKRAGAKSYFAELGAASRKFKSEGGLPGLNLQIEEGMDNFMKGWDDLAAGKVAPSTALLYKI